MQYDINGDGHEEVVLVTSEGEILFGDLEGNLMDTPKVRVPPLDIRKEWWKESTMVSPEAVGQFVRTSATRRVCYPRTYIIPV